MRREVVVAPRAVGTGERSSKLNLWLDSTGLRLDAMLRPCAFNSGLH